MHHPTDRITHTTAFVTPVVEHWLEREIAQLVHPTKDRSDDPRFIRVHGRRNMGEGTYAHVVSILLAIRQFRPPPLSKDFLRLARWSIGIGGGMAG